MTATNRARRPKRNTAKLKTLLFSSSLAAALAGTQLLNLKAAAQPSPLAVSQQPTTILEPEQSELIILLPPSGRGSQIQLPPIPGVVQPRLKPIARSSSSR